MSASLTYLLVHPEISRTRYNFKGIIENECLELEHLSAILKAMGHQVYLWDGQVENCPMTEALARYNPQVVYVCGRTRQENFMLEYCERAKAKNSEIITIIGGLHAQLCYERMYRDYVDFILTSYDFFAVPKLVDAMLEARKTSENARPEIALSGTCYQTDAGWKSNPSEPVDINSFPMPDRTYFYEHPDNYRYLEMEHAAWVRTAFSCPYRCRFCHRNRMNHSTYSARDINLVVDEIESIPDSNIYIVDDDFLYDEARLLRFIALIRERGIQKKYICYGRADFIASHKDLMRELKEIGFYYILVGIEAVSDKLLKDYDKRTSDETNRKAIAICNDLELHMMAMFILDLDFKRADFKLLYRYVKENNLRHVAVSIYTPEMGLESSEAFKDRLITDNPSHYDYLHLVAKPEHMSVRGFYLQYYKLLIRFFLRAKKEGVYDFIDYGDYVKSFIHNIFAKRAHDDE